MSASLLQQCHAKILLTQQNKQTNMQTAAEILATTYMVVHTTRPVSRTNHTHSDTTKTIPAFSITASKYKQQNNNETVRCMQ